MLEGQQEEKHLTAVPPWTVHRDLSRWHCHTSCHFLGTGRDDVQIILSQIAYAFIQINYSFFPPPLDAI